MKTLHFIPQDAWFFRDGRPYQKEENAQADVESLFPPFASTVSGAIRVALARNAQKDPWTCSNKWPIELDNVLGTETDNLGVLQFTGPFLHHHKHGLLFPAPLHLLGKPTPDAETPFTGLTLLEPGEAIETDAGSYRLPKANPNTPEGAKNAEGQWITSDGLKAILNGQLPAERDLVSPARLWAFESRVGLSRDAITHAVGDAALYSPRYVRLTKDACMVFGVNGLPKGWSIPESFPLGGEGRMAITLNRDDLKGLEIPASKRPPQNQFILVTLTPVVLPRADDGQPAWPRPEHTFPGVDAELLSACLGKPLHIGGWDSINSKPLPLRPCLPPGCVLFFEGTPPNEPTVRLGDRTAHGYGRCVIGHWPIPS